MTRALLTEADILATFPLDQRLVAERMNGAHERMRLEHGHEVRLRHSHYVLDADHTAIPVGFGTWAVWFELESTGLRRVAWQQWHDDRVGDVSVSTVFLGLDHSWSVGPDMVPRQLFETMVFFHEGPGEPEPGRDQGQWRYATWAQAAAGHAVVLARTRAYLAGEITRAQYDEEAEV